MKIMKMLLSATVLAGALPVAISPALAQTAPPQVTGKSGCVLNHNQSGSVVGTNTPPTQGITWTNDTGFDYEGSTGSSGGTSRYRLDAPCSNLDDVSFREALPNENDVTSNVTNPYTYGNFVTADEINSALQQVYTQLGSGSGSSAKDAEQDGRLDGHDTTITNINNTNVQQDTDISGLKQKDMEHHNRLDGHDTAITNINNKNTQQDTDISGLKQKDIQHDNRLDGHDTSITNITNKNVQQDTDLAALKAKDIVHDSRLDGHDTAITNINTRNTQQDTAISNVNQRVDAHDTDLTALKAKDVEHDNRLNGHDAAISGIQAKNTEQDARLDAHDTAIANLTDTNNRQDGDIIDLQVENAQQNARLDGHDAAINDINDINTRQDASITDLQTKHVEQADRLDSHDRQIGDLQSKHVEQADHLARHDQDIGDLQDKDLAHDVEIAGLHSKNAEQDGRINSIEDGAVFYNRDGQGNKIGGVTLNDGTGREVQLGNVAAGKDGKDAVNVDQLDQALASLGGGAGLNPDGTINRPNYTVGDKNYNNVGDALGGLRDLAVQYVPDADGKATNVVKLTGDASGSPVTVANVAAGVADTDAANYGQVKDRVSYDLKADGSRANAITLQGGGKGPVTIHNVAAGVAPTDAVNMGQFEQLRSASNDRFTGIDNRLANLSGEIRDVRKEARGGIASTVAMGQIRYDDRPGKASIGVGTGFFVDSFSLAAGAGYTSEDGRTRVNGSAGWSPSTGDLALGAGISWSFN